MNCLYCGKEISDKAKYCSEAHSKAYRRRTKAGDNPDKNDPDTARTFDFELTRTDKLFENKKPNYYSFGDKVFSRTCTLTGCNKKFKTRLNLLRFCSPGHMTQAIDRIAKDGRP